MQEVATAKSTAGVFVAEKYTELNRETHRTEQRNTLKLRETHRSSEKYSETKRKNTEIDRTGHVRSCKTMKSWHLGVRAKLQEYVTTKSGVFIAGKYTKTQRNAPTFRGQDMSDRWCESQVAREGNIRIPSQSLFNAANY